MESNIVAVIKAIDFAFANDCRIDIELQPHSFLNITLTSNHAVNRLSLTGDAFEKSYWSSAINELMADHLKNK